MARGAEIRERLKRGDKLAGCWLTMGSNIAAEIVALIGFDVLVIDQEHGPGDPMNAIALMQAARAGDAPCLLRVASHDPNLIKRALDTGIDGLIVPMVETPEQAAAIVAACRFPPDGMRGIAPGSVRAARFGLDRAGFVKTRGRDVFIACQVETKATVARIPAIAAVDGVDMMFIGRNDLASSIGHVADLNHPEAAALLGEAERRIMHSGTPMAGVPGPGDDARTMLGRGYALAMAGGDHTLLRDAAAAALRDARS